jgi:hypothetical protein
MSRISQPKPNQTCKECDRSGLYIFRIEGKPELFRLGPPSHGVSFHIHVCSPKDLERVQRKLATPTPDSRTDYHWRALVTDLRTSKTSWRYASTLEQLEARCNEVKTERIQYAKWTDHELAEAKTPNTKRQRKA